MLKNFLIIFTVFLLFATASDISIVDAQKSKDRKLSSKANIETSDYHRSQNERFVRNALKQINLAQIEFSTSEGAGDFGRLQDLHSLGLIDEALASGEKFGYQFTLTLRRIAAGVPPGFSVTARPRHYQRTGINSFFIDSRCQIHAENRENFEVSFDDPIVDECEPFLAFQREYIIPPAMRTLMLAQRDYFSGVGNGNYGTLQDLVDADLIEANTTISWDYWFINVEVIPASEGKTAGYKIWGTPLVYRLLGIRSYYVDESEILRAEDLQGDFANETTAPLLFEDEDLIKYAMRSLWDAQRHYPCISGVSCGSYATDFDSLSKARLIDFIVENGEFGGYRFEMDVVYSPKNPWLNDFEIYATPINPNKANSRSFYISKTSLLRGADKDGKTGNENDPYVEF